MIDLDSMSDDDKLEALESIHKSIAESKEVQKQKIAANVNLVLQSLKKMESDIRARYDETGKIIEKRVANIKDGRDGRNGVDGKPGKDGRNGKDGAPGPRGLGGLNGVNGVDGEDGVSVSDAHIDFDGSLIITLSDGRELNVGEVVSQDVVEKLKIITSGGAGGGGGGGTGTVTSVAATVPTFLSVAGSPITTSGTLAITLSGTALPVANGGTGDTTAIGARANLLPTYATNAGKVLAVNAGATDVEYIAVGGTGTVTSVGGTGTVNGITLTGTVTSAGNLTLGGALSGVNLATQVTGTLPIANGGTNATTAGDALTSLGAVGTIASADASIVVTRVGSAVDLSVSQTSPASVLIEQVRNNTGATLTKGTAVYISGTIGQIPTVSKALATGDSTSAQTLGLMTNDLANNSNGFVTIVGLVIDIDTSAYADGAQLYLSPTTAGTLTATKPYAPEHLVYMAIVAHSHPTQGKLIVRVQNGYEFDELHNVSAQSPTTGQTIVYNSSTSLWEKNTVSLTAGVNGTLPVANGGTGITSFGTGVATFLGTPSSANLAAAVTDETGSGALVFATNPTLTAPAVGGNLTLTGTGNRITGDFSNATVANRVAFQTSTSNGSTVVGAIPNGTGSTSVFRAFNAVDSANSSQATFGINVGAVLIDSAIQGTGTYLPITFYTGGSERMRIDSSGNLGIGTSSPSKKLDVVGQFRVSGSAASGYALIEYGTSATGTNNWHSGSEGDGSFRWYNGIFGAGTERMRIDSSGNVGIGIDVPAYQLDVATNARIATTLVDTNGAIEINRNGTGDRASYVDLHSSGAAGSLDYSARVIRGSGVNGNFDIVNTGTGALNLFHQGAGPVIAYTSNLERMRIDGSGNVFTANGKIGPSATQQHTMPAVTSDTYTLNNATQTLAGKTVEAVVLTNGYTEEVFAVTGTTPALSPTNGSIQTWTLTAISTPTAGTWAAGQSISMMINDTASLYTVVWTSLPVVWVGGTAPTLAPAGGFTIIQLWKVGTTIYGALTGQVA